jgi:hypothetical protein
MSRARETTKPAADDGDTEQATTQERPGGSGQDDPGKDEDDLSQTNTSNSDKSDDRSTEPSPSCGWRGVAKEMDVEPGR